MPGCGMPSETTDRPRVLELRGFGYAYPGGSAVLDGIDLRIEPAQCHVLSGPTGSGKTTLALAAGDLLPAGECQGEVRRSGHPRIGMVLQNPETQLLTTTVGAEVAFGLENLCVAPEQMRGRVMAALAATGLARPLDFAAERLSMGQKYRLLLAASLVMEPDLLILDEPTAQLDPAGRRELVAAIARLKETGVAFLVCEHHPERLADVADSHWELSDTGRLRAPPPPRADDADSPWEEKAIAPAAAATEDPPAVAAAPAATEDPPPIAARDLVGEGAAGEALWGGLTLSVGRGECAAISGPNGAGKTTLLRCLAGFAAPAQGELRVLGRVPRTADLRGRVGCLHQDPAKQIFESTVFEEVAFSRRRLGRHPQTLEAGVQAALDRCGLAALAGHSPHKLSYGQTHLVGLASVLAHEPELLLLDDPLAGLDPARAHRLLGLLRELARERGTAVVWTTHDSGAVPGWVDHRVELQSPTHVG